jgi:hypothetical protein
MTANSPQPTEAVGYYISRHDWPKSRHPNFYDDYPLPGNKILLENYEAIREEIERHFACRPEDFRPNFTPYAYHEQGWKTINLYSYFLRYPEHCARFPKIDQIVRSIPGMCMTQIAVLDPHTRIKAHYGDTNAVIRTHLGIRVPGTLPQLGIRVGRQERCWEEGKVFSISIAHRHYAWNYTDQHRIALVVDVIRDEFYEERYKIAGNTLAVIAMKFFATKLPVLKRLPRPLVTWIRVVLGGAFRLRLFLQRNFQR